MIYRGVFFMRMVITLKAENSIDLPIDHNHIIQSWIYSSISKELATFLHDEGFVVNGRTFKLFCFSRLMGNFSLFPARQRILYSGMAQLVITSPLNYFIEELANGMLLSPSVRLGSNDLMVERVDVYDEEITQDEIIVKTLSPITVYSTLLRMDGRKYTAYFAPRDPEYNEMITNNLIKKCQAILNSSEEFQVSDVLVTPLGMGKMNIVRYKNIIIKGYSGRLKLSGPKNLLQTAIECGLGSKNSQGFGCIEIERRH